MWQATLNIAPGLNERRDRAWSCKPWMLLRGSNVWRCSWKLAFFSLVSPYCASCSKKLRIRSELRISMTPEFKPEANRRTGSGSAASPPWEQLAAALRYNSNIACLEAA